MADFRVNIIGAGRVGQSFLGLLRAGTGWAVQDVTSTHISSAEAAVSRAGRGRAVADLVAMRPADIWILSVPDTKIAEVAAALADIWPRQAPQSPVPIALHCSGFFPAETLAPLRGLGWHLASVHPALSFADPAVAVTLFPGTYCALEGDAAAIETLGPLLQALGAHPFAVASKTKSLYHAAAVFSNNFTTVLQAIAREAWAEAGVPDDVAQALNAGLLRSTLDNVTSVGPTAALTGPAARGDMAVLSQQATDVSAWHPEAGALYRQLSELATRLKRDGGTQARAEAPTPDNGE